MYFYELLVIRNMKFKSLRTLDCISVAKKKGKKAFKRVLMLT